MQTIIRKPVFAFFMLTALILGLLGARPQPSYAGGLLQDIPAKPLAKDFHLPDSDGKMHRLSDFRGKTVILNFWATWCPPCRKEMPSMQRAWNKLKAKGNIVMIALHVGGNEEKVWNFMGDGDYDFLVLIDKSGKIPKQWPMMGLPSTFIISPEGKITLRAIGERAWDDAGILKQIEAVK